MNCPECSRLIFAGSTKCPCGWKATDSGDRKIPPVKMRCHFEGDGKCRSDHDRFNKNSPPRGATIKVDDLWLCNWHFENLYDLRVRATPVSSSELKFKKKLDEVNHYVEVYLEEYPGASKKDACFAYMKEKGLLASVPKQFLDEADEERRAIQEEQ